MKTLEMSLVEPDFPLTYTCWNCKSKLLIDKKDLRVRETLGEIQFCGVDCCICGAVGRAPISDVYENRFLSEKDLVGKFLSFVFSFGGILK